MRKAEYYENDDSGDIRCMLCPQNCKIARGKNGLCLVRKNVDGELIAASYGRICAIALDPIEKKPLKMFYPGSKILSVGSYGCNFKCKFCQNYEISQYEQPYRELTPEIMVDMAVKAKNQGNIGIAYTYNEPLTSYEFVLDCSILAHKNDLKNVIVTNGFINVEPMEKLLSNIDAMNIDLKAFTQKFYKEICNGSLEPVKKTIALCVRKCHVEVTTLLVPGLNDSEDEISLLAQWIAGISPEIPLHLTRHHPDYRMQEPKSIEPERVYKLADVARQHLKYVFCGNV